MKTKLEETVLKENEEKNVRNSDEEIEIVSVIIKSCDQVITSRHCVSYDYSTRSSISPLPKKIDLCDYQINSDFCS